MGVFKGEMRGGASWDMKSSIFLGRITKKKKKKDRIALRIFLH